MNQRLLPSWSLRRSDRVTARGFHVSRKRLAFIGRHMRALPPPIYGVMARENFPFFSPSHIHFVEPPLQSLHFCRRQRRNGGFNFGKRAHGSESSTGCGTYSSVALSPPIKRRDFPMRQRGDAAGRGIACAIANCAVFGVRQAEPRRGMTRPERSTRTAPSFEESHGPSGLRALECIREEMLQGKRADYGQKIISALSKQRE